MLRNRFLRYIAILCVWGVFCLPMACPVAGQEDPAEPPAGQPPEGQPPVRPPEPAPEPLDLSTMMAARSPVFSLASIPNMFGDFYCHQLQVCDFAQTTVVDVPPAGGGRRVKISDNDKALPMDRVYFTYNHFQNALDVSGPGPEVHTFPLDRYTVGVEKTFLDGLWAAEVRMPFSSAHQFATSDFNIQNQEVGNLQVIVKRLLYRTEYSAAAIGLGIETPTADDTSGQAGASSYVLHNETVHLSPYIGWLTAPNDRVFYQLILQVDVATNGSRVDFGGDTLGKFSDQSLFFADLSAGYWLYHNPGAYGITGLAPILELHYTSTLQDADALSGFDGQTFLEFTNVYNRVDLLNFTVGLHAEIGMTTLSVGGVFPLRQGSNRVFDAEVQVFLNRMY